MTCSYLEPIGHNGDVFVPGPVLAYTNGPGDETDASFSPNSRWVVYSAEGAGWPLANLLAQRVTGGTPVRLTDSDAYDGAPSWSPDGKRILFESHPGDPDGSAGTRLFVLDDVPAPAGS